MYVEMFKSLKSAVDQDQLVDIQAVSASSNAFAALRRDAQVIAWGRLEASQKAQKVSLKVSLKGSER